MLKSEKFSGAQRKSGRLFEFFVFLWKSHLFTYKYIPWFNFLLNIFLINKNPRSKFLIYATYIFFLYFLYIQNLQHLKKSTFVAHHLRKKYVLLYFPHSEKFLFISLRTFPLNFHFNCIFTYFNPKTFFIIFPFFFVFCFSYFFFRFSCLRKQFLPVARKLL